MTTKTDYEIFESSSPENQRLLRQEELILEVTEAILEAMEREGITKTELARRMGKSKGFVSQILSGSRNLTLRTLADAATALEMVARVRLGEVRSKRRGNPLELRLSNAAVPVSWSREGIYGHDGR